MTRKIILLDVDGVLCNFNKSTLEFHRAWQTITNSGDAPKTEDDITDFNTFKALGNEELWEPYRRWANRKNFCYELEPYAYAWKMVEGLRELGDIHVVTTPFDTDFWHSERLLWLQYHFGIRQKDVTFSHQKYMIDGDILIDDCHDNCYDWSKERRKPIVMPRRPWNADAGPDSYVKNCGHGNFVVGCEPIDIVESVKFALK